MDKKTKEAYLVAAEDVMPNGAVIASITEGRFEFLVEKAGVRVEYFYNGKANVTNIPITPKRLRELKERAGRKESSMKVNDFAREVCKKEGKKVQVNIAQVLEILKVINKLTGGCFYRMIWRMK